MNTARLRELTASALLLGLPAGAEASTPPENEAPDLITDSRGIRESLTIEKERFSADDCAIQEGCVRGPGGRTLLRMDTRTINIGSGDLVVGAPENNAAFYLSPCHGHYHFRSYVSFELLHPRTRAPVTVEGSEIVTWKQGFCLYDDEPFTSQAEAKYTCSFQGISSGWSDFYGRELDCQWLDVTGVPPGDYLVRVTVNPEGILPEARRDNNSIEFPVRLP